MTESKDEDEFYGALRQKLCDHNFIVDDNSCYKDFNKKRAKLMWDSLK